MKGMANKKLGLMAFFVLLGFILSGCGLDALEEEKAPVLNASDGAVVAYYSGDVTSSTVCYVCHSDAAEPAGLSPVFGDSAADGWLDGPHANDHSMDDHHNELNLAPDNVGFPDYGDFSDSTCKTCHDKRGDGMTLAAFYAENGIAALGRIDRPIIGCEGCHGSSKNHSDIGAPLIQYAAPGAEGCQPCHNDSFPDAHLTYHPEGDRIYEDYMASPHAHSANSHIYNASGLHLVCGKCHTDEYAKEYRNMPYGALFSRGYDNVTYSNVQCRTCHDAHNPDTLLKAATASNSAEYETCTECHMDQGMIHGVDSGHSWGPEEFNPDHEVGVGNFDASEIIYDTHIDNDSTAWIEGYILDTDSDRVCRECHNVHSADNTINDQWAKSAHAGHILEEKEDAFSSIYGTADEVAEAKNILSGTTGNGAVLEADSAWSHYNWGPKYDGACAKCKTSSALKSYVSNPYTYNAATVSYTATGDQRELLYCWACHTDSAGGLRDTFTVSRKTYPLLFKNTAEYAEPAGRIASVPDLNGSNICLVCHSGRKSGEQIATFLYNGSSIYDNLSFTKVYPHYYPAGGMVFKTVG